MSATGPGTTTCATSRVRTWTRGGELLVAEVDGEVVAMGAIKRVDDERAEVKRIRVDPGFRRRGLADALLRSLEDRARDLGYRRLVLDTAADAQPAQRQFEKHPFRRTGTTVLGGFDTLLYEKVSNAIWATLIARERGRGVLHEEIREALLRA